MTELEDLAQAIPDGCYQIPPGIMIWITLFVGFLSTGNEYSPGNYGMLDLSMALKWVYDNIYAFNGNKDLITVYGPGSGASAAGLLAIAPDTKHMVKQIFGQVVNYSRLFYKSMLKKIPEIPLLGPKIELCRTSVVIELTWEIHMWLGLGLVQLFQCISKR